MGYIRTQTAAPSRGGGPIEIRFAPEATRCVGPLRNVDLDHARSMPETMREPVRSLGQIAVVSLGANQIDVQPPKRRPSSARPHAVGPMSRYRQEIELVELTSYCLLSPSCDPFIFCPNVT